MVGSIATQTADASILVSTTLALHDSCLWIVPMVTNTPIGHLPTSPLRVLPTLLLYLLLAYELWVTFPVMGAYLEYLCPVPLVTLPTCLTLSLCNLIRSRLIEFIPLE